MAPSINPQNRLDRWLDHIFAKYRTRLRSGLTCNAVPFKLQPLRLSETRQGFTEAAREAHRTYRFLYFYCMCFGIAFLLATVFFGSTKHAQPIWFDAVILVAAAGSLTLLCGIAVRGIQRRTRHLWIDGLTLQVHLERVNARNEIIEKLVVPIEECRLQVHTVDLVTVRDRFGTPVFRWKGFAAVVHVRDDRFVIGCTKKREELDQYVAGLPKWLQTIRAPDGDLIQASANLRLF